MLYRKNITREKVLNSLRKLKRKTDSGRKQEVEFNERRRK